MYTTDIYRHWNTGRLGSDYDAAEQNNCARNAGTRVQVGGVYIPLIPFTELRRPISHISLLYTLSVNVFKQVKGHSTLHKIPQFCEDWLYTSSTLNFIGKDSISVYDEYYVLTSCRDINGGRNVTAFTEEKWLGAKSFLSCKVFF